MIKKFGNQWCIVHHRKRGMIGKPIPGGCHSTKKAAIKHHAAILISKKRKK